MYFFQINARAERLYEPVPFAGEIIMFSGKGMYEDLELGWGGLAKQGIVTYEVPGEHKDNRDIMREPNVVLAARRLEEYLGNAGAVAENGSSSVRPGQATVAVGSPAAR
jgi:hypothetical protein